MEGAVIILGATSQIARAFATSLAKKGTPLYLGGRDGDELKRIASDISIRSGVEVKWALFDAEEFDSHKGFIDEAEKAMGGIVGALLAFGDLGVHEESIRDFGAANRIITRNYSGACSFLTHMASRLERKRGGFIVGISSVAGDRGRMSNYLYGSAKGGFTLFLQGLRNRLYHSNVHVMTVKPGFVDTKMIYGLKVPFAADPAAVGEEIARGLERKKNILYVPRFWRVVMAVTKALPEALFKRLKL